MKTTKRRIEIVSFFDHTGISGHLEKMASKGWMIEKVTNFGWIYRSIEPKKVCFAVSYYPKASEFDPEPSEDQKMFHDFCAHTGWRLACTSAQMQIFFNEQEDPIPIETEPMLEVQAIHASAKKSLFPSYILLFICALLNGGLLVNSLLNDPIDALSSSAQLFSGFAFLLLAILCVAELGSYFVWYTRAKKAAEHGVFLKTKGTAKLQKGMLIFLFLAAAYWVVNFVICGDTMQRWLAILMGLYMPALFGIVNGLKAFMKRKKVSRGINRTVTLTTSFVVSFAMMAAITFGVLRASSSGLLRDKGEETYEHGGMTWVIHQDDLPLVVEDLMEVEYDGYIKRKTGDMSLLLGHFEMRQSPRYDAENYKDIPRLEYTITIVNVPALYEMCKNQTIDKKDETDNTNIPEGFKRVYLEQNPAPWRANEVYRLAYQDTGPLNQYLLCYDDRIVEINFDWEPAAQQMAIVGEKLNNR